MHGLNYLVEFLGTFLFLYLILNSTGYGQSQPFVIAIGLLAAILLFGSVSGGHFNPAITAMMWAKGDAKEPIGYILAQVAGGLVALKAHQYITENASGRSLAVDKRDFLRMPLRIGRKTLKLRKYRP